MQTGFKLIAVPPVPPKTGPKRHVTADRLTTLCGAPVPPDWYACDAGEFGKPGDCPECAATLKAEDADAGS